MMENGEFPVEIRASSAAKCEKARQQILDFLSSTSAVVEVTKKKQERKIKNTPQKIILALSPRKPLTLL